MDSKNVVVIAMSGGVDSSVAAALLVERGYSVIGMMLRLWSDQSGRKANRCCAPDSMAMARRVSSILSIPFYVLDARQVFYDSVILPFIDDYAHNLTPNPCISCNRSVRWDYLFNHARAAGADYLATGHYARTTQDADLQYQVRQAVDLAKDQSYVLHMLTQEKLSHALFPLGDLHKPEVRELARKFNLPVADRPDSQDLCFLGGEGDYRQFLRERSPIPINPGLIMDTDGNILGNHNGLAFFTIGQRKGLHISSPAPLYVLEKDASRNVLIVGRREQAGRDDLVAEKVTWIAGKPPESSFKATVKIRYKAIGLPASIRTINDHSIHIKLDKKIYDITPGQAAVLYNDDICLGGGTITDQIL